MVKLDGILVKGSGTDDGWRVLKCKDKYAGEIHVELTFYDMRPKDEPEKKPVARKVVEKEPVRETVGPRKLGGAREMGSSPREVPAREVQAVRERPVRRPVPGKTTERQVSPNKSEERRTRRGRHSYHPDMVHPEQRELRTSQSRYFEEAPEMRTSRSRREEPEPRRSRSRYPEDEQEDSDRRRELRQSHSRVFDNAPDLRHSQSRYFEDAPEMRQSRSRQDEIPSQQLRHSRSGYFEEAPEMRMSRSRQGEPREVRHSQSKYFEEEQPQHELPILSCL